MNTGGYGGQNYYGAQPGYAPQQYSKPYPTQNYGAYGGQQYGGFESRAGHMAENCCTMCAASFCASLAMNVCCDCLTPGGLFWSI